MTEFGLTGDDLWLFLRVLVAIVLGGVIGFERERHNQPAGFRTHMLVAGGAAAFVVASIYGFRSPTGGNTDVSRVAAQVVTGVGFLGAGSLWRTRGSVRGLTTAASIWIAAAIGMLAGTGTFALAAFTTFLTFIVLHFLRLPDKKRLDRRDFGEPSLIGRPGRDEEDDDDEAEERVMRSAVRPPNSYRL
ncbi:MAG TPA: MgtC/SapB family protein [Chloroflexota bacterium]